MMVHTEYNRDAKTAMADDGCIKTLKEESMLVCKIHETIIFSVRV